MRRIVLGLTLGMLFATASTSLVADEPLVVKVWPGEAPGEPSGIGAESEMPPQEGQREVIRLTNVTEPTLTVYRPSAETNTGAAVLIAPGGGYHILAWDLEGEEVAAWLNSIGVTGIILKYRVPRRAGTPQGEPPVEPLQDAQRALSLIRGHAEEWGIDPERVGMLGFSAGGHLTAATSTGFATRRYEPIDAIDEKSCRPDFSVLVYPAYLNEPGTTTLKENLPIGSDSPPAFLVHAADDRLSPENSIAYFLALKKAEVPAELHVYTTGGHGFGLRPSDDPCSTWPARCADWLQRQGWLSAK